MKDRKEAKKEIRRNPKLQEFDCYLGFLVNMLHQQYMGNGEAEQMKQNKRWFRVVTAKLGSYISDMLSQYQNVDQNDIRRSLRRLKRSKLIKSYECDLNGKTFKVKVR